MAYKPDIRRLVDDRDMEGLVAALRYPDNAEVRTRAARGLGKVGTVNTVESLIRSHLQDPDPGVQQAALDALHEMIGSEADLAIPAYVLPDDPWIEEKEVSAKQPEDEAPLEESSDAGEDDLEDENKDDLIERQDTSAGSWRDTDIQALVSIIRLDHSHTKRLKAIQALSEIPNTRAVDALASITLWSEEKSLRDAAREALAAVYGDNLEELLESYRQASSEVGNAADLDEDDEEDEEDFDDDEDEDEDEDEIGGEDEDEEETEAADPADSGNENRYIPLNPPDHASPVIREEKTGWTTYLLLGVLLLAVLAVVIYLLTR